MRKHITYVSPTNYVLNKFHFILITLGLLVSSIFVEHKFNFLSTEQTEGVIVKKSKITSLNDITKLVAPCDSMYFCDEKIPLSSYVKGTVEKHENRFFYLKRRNHRIVREAKKWFPLIEPILASYGIPEDFKYFTIVESNLSNVKSPQNAVGYWQLIPNTARSLGLIVNDEIDERYDPVKSTHAACKYLQKSYKRLGNWSNVAASYNMGIGGLRRQLRRQKKDSYYDLKLNRETAQYVYKGIAVKRLIEKAGKYSYRLAKKPESLTTERFVIKENIENLETFAQNHKIDVKTLKKFNPWIRGNRVTYDSTHKFVLELPITQDELTVAMN
ncbi:MAG: lytic transglycosylase domain-containing protein [Cytophagales bacterium]|nr:lytic transglycosylase domain-containing protein [Cytophagales bacterium]